IRTPSVKTWEQTSRTPHRSNPPTHPHHQPHPPPTQPPPPPTPPPGPPRRSTTGRCLMSVETDDNSKFRDYAHPARLVSIDWLAGQRAPGNADGNSDLVVVESDEDVLLYDTGHIPGAVKVDWHLDLNDPVR